MTDHANTLSTLIDQLHGRGRLRVWSIVITIFGDAVQVRGERVAMADLQAMTSALRIDVGALRAAMSRLAKEGWVVREKLGRHSFYRLSRLGQDMFLGASERIYTPPAAIERCKWRMAIPPKLSGETKTRLEREIRDLGGITLPSGPVLWPEWAAPSHNLLAAFDMLVLDAELRHFPQWALAHIAPSDIAARYRSILSGFGPFAGKGVLKLTPLQAMATRLLLIHQWRRLVLRHPLLPAECCPADWPGGACHALVADVYHRLLPSSESWWGDSMPKAGPELVTRFCKVE
jgi:phenylacetic acid degradation operon negative regulatory protein